VQQRLDYIIRKLMFSLITLAAVLVFNFFLFRIIPSSFLDSRFSRYVQNLLGGNLGESFRLRWPVSELLGARLRPTILLIQTGELERIIVGRFWGLLRPGRDVAPSMWSCDAGGLVVPHATGLGSRLGDDWADLAGECVPGDHQSEVEDPSTLPRAQDGCD